MLKSLATASKAQAQFLNVSGNLPYIFIQLPPHGPSIYNDFKLKGIDDKPLRMLSKTSLEIKFYII